MPIYEYDCGHCKKRFEVLVPSASSPAPACPDCGKPNPRKAFSAFAVAAPDPSPHCQSCPTASQAVASGSCSAGKCPFSG